MDIRIDGGTALRGTVRVPGDKSISHRAVMIGAISEGITEIRGFLEAEDCLATVNCLREMGIEIHAPAGEDKSWRVFGKGLYGLKKPKRPLYVGNSGTTIRLLSGILAGQNFEAQITGDESICRRPMGRVIEPLSLMGADISGIDGNYPPLKISGGKLQGIRYKLPVASAQVKSAVLLAGLYAHGETLVVETVPARNHTEVMLKAFGAQLIVEPQGIRLVPGPALQGRTVIVPGDFSSAAFFIVGAAICPDSDVIIRQVGKNSTRTGLLRVLKQMGADLDVTNETIYNGEPVADIRVKSSSRLRGVEVGGNIIPTLIDEIPALTVAAAFAEGTTVIKDAKELRLKESDRIKAIAQGLSQMGAKILETEDGLIVEGSTRLKAACVESYRDHRIAMALTIAALRAEGSTTIKDAECINISYPTFFRDLKSVINR